MRSHWGGLSSDNQSIKTLNMALIIRDELMEQCVLTGRALESKIRTIPSDRPLTDEELEATFEPIVKYVEELTETRIRRELDEQEAAQKEKLKANKRADVIAALRCELEDSVVLNVNGKRKTVVSEVTAKRTKRFISKKPVPEMEGASYKEFDPQVPLDDLEDEEYNVDLEEYDSPHWDKFIPSLDITLPPESKSLIDYNHGVPRLPKYLAANNLSRQKAIERALAMSKFMKNDYVRGSNNLEKTLQTSQTMAASSETDQTAIKVIREMMSFGYEVTQLQLKLWDRPSIYDTCSVKKCAKVCGENVRQCESCRNSICAECWAKERTLCKKH